MSNASGKESVQGGLGDSGAVQKAVEDKSIGSVPGTILQLVVEYL